MSIRRARIALLLVASVASAQDLEMATAVAFTEGPTVDSDGNVYFSDLVADRIMRLSKDGLLSVWREKSNHANGLVIDPQGRLIAAEGGPSNRMGVDVKNIPRVTRTDLATGRVEILADSSSGTPFAAPNDLGSVPELVENRSGAAAC